MYTYHIFFVHSSVDGHLGCFPVLAIVNSASVNIGMHVSFLIMIFSEYMPSGGVARSYVRFISGFLRNLHIVVPNSCISLYSHQHCTRVPLALVRRTNLEPVIHSEVSQKEKNKYSILTRIYGI